MLARSDIAACEGKSVNVMDIGSALLEAEIPSSCIKVHMRLSQVVTGMFVHIDPKHGRFVEERGTSVGVLNKTFYGCVEVAA